MKLRLLFLMPKGRKGDTNGSIRNRNNNSSYFNARHSEWSIFCNKKSTVLVAYRLEQLEKKQDVHNQVIDRVYELEKSVALNSEDIKVANHRIQDLEKKG